MGELSILSPAGTENLTWDPEDSNEVCGIRNRFDLYLDKGYSAFNLDESGGEGKKILDFDPFAPKIIMVPKLGGG